MKRILLLQLFMIILSFGFIWEFEPSKLKRQLEQGKTVLLLYYLPQSDIYRDFIHEYKLIDSQILEKKVENFILGKIDCEEFEDYCDNVNALSFPMVRILTLTTSTDIPSCQVNDIIDSLAQINIQLTHIKPAKTFDITSETFDKLNSGP